MTRSELLAMMIGGLRAAVLQKIFEHRAHDFGFGQTRRHLGAIFHALARQKECRIIEGHLMPDHVHMCIAIPPKHPVASVIGFLKGKSAIAIARLNGKERNFTGEHFWARGYAVSTVGFELEQVRTYIREQEAADGAAGQF